ncbi:hypothetical protein ACFY5J_28420 [Peribacillus butanolivorans]
MINDGFIVGRVSLRCAEMVTHASYTVGDVLLSCPEIVSGTAYTHTVGH